MESAQFNPQGQTSKQTPWKPKEPQTALQEQAGTPKEAQRTPKNPDGQTETPTETNNYHCSQCCAPPLAGFKRWGSAERQRMEKNLMAFALSGFCCSYRQRCGTIVGENEAWKVAQVVSMASDKLVKCCWLYGTAGPGL